MSKVKWVLVAVGVIIVIGTVGTLKEGDAKIPSSGIIPTATMGREYDDAIANKIWSMATARPKATARPRTLADTTECAITRRACEHFQNVLEDISAGILTTTETRKKFQEIYNSTKGGIPSAEAAARRALAATTQDDVAGWLIAIMDLSDACLLCQK